MKIDKTRPHEVLKDPEKAKAEKEAKRKRRGETITFLFAIGIALWWFKSPETLKATFNYLMGLLK